MTDKHIDKLLNTKQTSELTGIAPGTLANRRPDAEFNALLPFVRVGKTIRYRLSDIQKFIGNLTGSNDHE